MLFDTHTNLLWYPDHLSDEFVEVALAAKRVKMRLSSDVYYADEAEDEHFSVYERGLERFDGERLRA